MLLQPGLTAEDCPNQAVCGTIIQLTEEERAELYAAIRENNRRIVQTVMMSPQEEIQGKNCRVRFLPPTKLLSVVGFTVLWNYPKQRIWKLVTF